MAFTAKPYPLTIEDIFEGGVTVDWDSDTINLTLHTSSYTPDVDTHDRRDDLTNELSTADGYTAGGVTLSGCTVGYTSATDTVFLDATDPTWTSASFTYRTYVVQKVAGGASSADPLICYGSESGDQTAQGGDYTLVFPSTGIVEFDC